MKLFSTFRNVHVCSIFDSTIGPGANFCLRARVCVCVGGVPLGAKYHHMMSVLGTGAISYLVVVRRCQMKTEIQMLSGMIID